MSNITQNRRRAAHVGRSYKGDAEALSRPREEFLEDSLGFKEYSSNAVLDGQYFDNNATKRSHPICETFNLGNADDLKRYNALLEKVDPKNPSIEILENDTQFYRGNFYVKLTYSKVWYLLPEKK